MPLPTACQINGPLGRNCENDLGGLDYVDLINWRSGVLTDSDSDGLLDTAAFATVNVTDVTNAAEAQVTTDAAHGKEVGDYVLFSGTSTIAQLIGQFQVVSVVDALNFTIDLNTTSLPAFTGSTVELFLETAFRVTIEDTGSSGSSTFNSGNNRYYVQNFTFAVKNSTPAGVALGERINRGEFIAVGKAQNGQRPVFGRILPLKAQSDGGLFYEEGDDGFVGQRFVLSRGQTEMASFWDPAADLPTITAPAQGT